MIISHKYKFIFLKTNKTAGTSIEIALSKHCGADDIITPVSPNDEAIRKELGYPGPQNYLSPLWNYNVRDLTKLLNSGKKKLKFYNHIPAREVKLRVGEEVWNSYYKFCFERNPWDRVISHYYWSYRSEPRPTIADYLESQKLLMLKHRGYDLYTIDGQLAVDHIYLFEKLPEALEAVRDKLGIPETLELPRTKTKSRKDKRSYREILSNEERDRISELFRDEINLFGYEF